MSSGLPSIRRELLIRLLTTALVPLLIVGALSLALWSHYLRSNALEDGEHLALNVAAELQGRLLAAETTVVSLSQILERFEKEGAPAGASDSVLGFATQDSPLFETIYRVNAEGIVMGIGLPRLLAQRQEDYVGIDLSRLPIFQRVKFEGRALWSDSHLSLTTGQPSLTYCMPFRNGFLVASTTLNRVEGLTTPLDDVDEYKTLLLDSKGVVLLGTDGKRPSRILKLDHLELVKNALRGETGSGSFQWQDEACLGTCVALPQTGWLIIAFAKTDVVLRTLSWMIGLSVVGIVLGMALAVVLSLVVSNRIAQPLAVFSAKTREIAEGNYVIPFDAQPYSELDQMAGALRQMGLAIQEREQRQQAIEAELRQSQKMEAMGKLVGGIAHDFNNMLQGIRGFTELAKIEVGDGHAAQDSLDETLSACSRATELVQQLLIFSRKDKPSPTHLELNTFLPSSLKMLRRVVGEQITIEFTPSEKPAWILIDRVQIEQVFMNLSVNASDAMPKGGRLHFSLVHLEADDPARSRVELSVSDTGHGMRPEVLARIFDPFFTTKDVGKGTGLGLATVYGIMQQCGGSIRVESEPGKGTVFHLSFPRVAAPGDATVAPADATGTKPSVGAAEDVRTVLVAEDDAVLRQLINGVLKAEGYVPLLAENGLRAVELFELNADCISLVILDVVMPGRNGAEVAEHLWRRRPELPILFISGYFTDYLDPSLIPPEKGRILRKPYGQQQLVAVLREMLATGR